MHLKGRAFRKNKKIKMNRIKELLKPKLKLLPGTRLTSFLFITASIAIAFGILFAASIYYNIDTGEVIVEEIQRVTNVLRATYGLIVGGSSNQNPASGYKLEVVGDTLFSGNVMVNNVGGTAQELRFLEGGSSPAQYIGLKAPDGLTTNRVYILPHHDTSPPSDDYVLTWQSGNRLEWKQVTAVGGAGDITAVGDVASGSAFTSDGTQGTSLWFVYDAGGGTYYRGQLTRAPLSQNRTYTLPDLSGTITLTSGNLTDGSVLFASGGLIAQDNANFYWDNSLKRLRLGGSLAIREGGSNPQYYTIFQGGDQSADIIYTLPPNPGSANYVLTTDGSGNLSWQPITGGPGGVVGSGTANRLAKWTGTSSLGNAGIEDTSSAVRITLTDSTTTIFNNLTVSGTGIHSFSGILDPYQMDAFTLIGNITGSGNPNITGIGNLLANYVEANTLQVATIQSGSGDILLNPASGIVQLATGDYIRTSGGFEIGKSGTQILREIVPIMGFDLPVRSATTSYVKISRDIVNYPLNPCRPGTQRVHKLVIRYGSATTTDWEIAISTGPVYSFSLPANGDISKGSVQTVAVTIPTPSGSCTNWNQGTETDDWWVRVRPNGQDIMIYQIFLAGYDEIL